MALTSTTLAAACGAGDLTLSLTSTSSGFPAVGAISSPSQIMKVDGEFMLVQVVPVSGVVKVKRRGDQGTAAVPHEALAVVQTSSDPADFLPTPVGASTPMPPYVDDLVTIGVDTTFTAAGTLPTATTLPMPVKNTTYLITKASACAITIISASAASAGVRMTFLNGVAAANTVTYTPGFLGDTTSSDVATSAAKVGAALIVEVGYTGLLSALNVGTGTSYTLG